LENFEKEREIFPTLDYAWFKGLERCRDGMGWIGKVCLGDASVYSGAWAGALLAGSVAVFAWFLLIFWGLHDEF
jgi:hypothetical protein